MRAARPTNRPNRLPATTMAMAVVASLATVGLSATAASAEPAKCTTIRDQMNALGNSGVVGNSTPTAIGYLVLYAQYKAAGCSEDPGAPPRADVLARDEFRIKVPDANSSGWYMRVKDGNHHLEGWSDAHAAGLSSHFKITAIEPAKPMVFGEGDAAVFQIQVSDGPDQGKCLRPLLTGNHEVVTGPCFTESGEAYNVPFWSLEDAGGGKSRIRYREIGYTPDQTNKYHLIPNGGMLNGVIGFNSDSHPNGTAGYAGWADVLPSNSRAWELVK
ncbi:hypothetical protein ACIBEA_30440 [Streptomyces sp. NPDC051555]|uniref:hypothetical protein n=1 Tax=Streptomyces sp. NPDC051555 TaxID=3365657 RepID=UPI0037B80470